MRPATRGLAWAALGAAAVAADAGTIEAQAWLARCGAGGTSAALQSALALGDHARAYPWTSAAMAAWHLLAGPPLGVRARGAALLVMLCWMPAACLAAWWLSGMLAPMARVPAYPAVMLLLGTLPGLAWRAAGRRARAWPGLNAPAGAGAPDAGTAWPAPRPAGGRPR